MVKTSLKITNLHCRAVARKFWLGGGGGGGGGATTERVTEGVCGAEAIISCV